MSAARTLRQLASTSSRLSSRQLSLARLPLIARTASRVPTADRAFSVSARSLKAGSSDVLLAEKLGEELQYEKESNLKEEPEFLTAFKTQGIWKIGDTPGENEVTLTRKFGNETIRVVFSVADLQNQDPNEYDDPEEDEERPEEEQEDTEAGDMVRALVSITKSASGGALEIEMTVQSGRFIVENVTYYADSKLGHEVNSETDWKRRGLYAGPEFSTLDVALQESFEQFLEDRDLGEGTAFFIPEYAQHKEQREYVRWLENVRGFVDA
ncbi:mitochondrial glycoprotein [Mycena alexandri]|uniref:Mitochondrial glycoprotein n=1 Tax=Mycena alexandri TaxID=1745969 RepID=A0AAD6WXK5_9AGAR|nr:mitochondrial glycoprotein [Mycena alexandri]